MNILLIAPSAPGNMDSGGNQRTSLLHQALSKFGTVYTVVPVQSPKLEKVLPDGKTAYCCIAPKYSFSWFINRLFLHNVQILKFPGKNVLSKLENFGPEKFDLVACRYTVWAGFFRAWKIAPLYLDIDDLPVESFDTVYRKKVKFAWLWKFLLKVRCDYIFKKSAGLWIANKHQLPMLEHKNKGWLQNIPLMPISKNAEDIQQQPVLLSVGYLGYEPNYEGVDRFVDRVWPQLKSKHPNLRYRIVGRDLPESYRVKWQNVPGVEVAGFVDDINIEYQQCLFSVAPIFSGSGTCIKVLESLCHNRICLCSEFACRGLEDTDLNEFGLVSAATDQEAVSAALKLIEDPDRRIFIQNRSADAVNKAFNMETFERQVERIIQQV